MKNWFLRNKIILISFVGVSIVLFIMTGLQINIIIQPEVLEELNQYIETKEITSSLRNYVLVAIVNLIIFAVWAILFLMIMWKIFFPTNKVMREAFQIDSFEFLFNMPSRIKKELKRDE